MKDTYRSSADALRDALAHAVLRGGPSSLGVLHQGAGADDVLCGFDGTAQAGRIRGHLDRLGPVAHALIVASYAPRRLTCNCRAECCAGSYTNPEWKRAMETLVVRTAPLLTGHVPDVRLRTEVIANALRHIKETNVDVALRCGVHRDTVAAHKSVIEAALVGTRQQVGEFDHAFARVDTLLREAGIVVSESEAHAEHAQENDHETRAAVAG